nr:reticulon-like protein 1 [Quercus suber]
MAAPQQQQSQYPNLNPSGLVNSAQNAMSNIANSQTVQSLQSGPVAEKTRTEVNATKSEFSNLASSRTTPQAQTATGQPLTHYHSFFYNLLSWENPRATAISYVSVVLAIFVARYVPVIRLTLRALWVLLGVVAAVETTAKLALGQSIAAHLRPRQYLTIPRETLEASLEDVEQLINFFVIEVQRVLFAENVFATTAAFFTTLLTYFLIKVTPAWGLALIFTTAVYFLPLIYLQNQELIDSQLSSASKIASDQTKQIRNIAQQHTSNAVSTSQSALKDASAKAQEMIGQAKQTAVDKGLVSQETAGLGSTTSSTQKIGDNVAPVTSSTKIEPLAPQSQSNSSAPKSMDGSADLIDTQIPAPGISKADTEEILGVKKEDFPIAPVDQPFSDGTETHQVKAEGGPIASQ